MKIEVKLKEAQIHLTDKCNLKCIFCDNPNPHAKDLPDNKWHKIIKELCELNPFRLIISGGGEPLLRPKLLMYAIKTARLRGIKTSVITNGTLVTRSVAKEIVELECDEWRESIHSTTRSLDTFIRGRDLLFQSFRGIKYIVEWKKKLKKELPEVVIWMTLTKFAIDQVDEMIRKAALLGVDSIFLRMVNPPTRKEVYPTLSQRKLLVKNMKKYKGLASTLGIKLRTDFMPEDILPMKVIDKPNDGGRLACLIPFQEIVIFADGRVSPCCNFIRSSESSIGIDNIRNKSLKEIWFGRKFNRFREMMIKGILPEKCRECTPDLKTKDREYKSKLEKADVSNF